MNYRACAWLRRKLNASPELGLAARALALAIVSYVDADGVTRVPPSQRDLADLLVCTPDHIRKLTRQLEQAGVLVATLTVGRSVTYRIPFGVIHTPSHTAGSTPSHTAGNSQPHGRDTYIRDVGTTRTPAVCDVCGEPVADPSRWRHEECPAPPIAAAGGA